MDMDAAHCKKSCFKLPPGARVGDLGLVAKTKLRLVDMCKNILSDEDTCYHSDHAISRCFAQAVYANFSENVKCWKREKFSNPVPFLQCVTNICMNPAKVTHVIPASI